MSAPTFVQLSAYTTITTGTATVAFPGGNTLGNCLVVFVSTTTGATGAQYDAAFSDTAGNTYVRVGLDAGGITCVYFCASCKAGANSLQLAKPTAGSVRWQIYGAEYTGTGKFNLDTSATTTKVQTGGALSITISPNFNNSIVIWIGYEIPNGVAFSAQTAGYSLRSPNNHNFHVDSSGTTISTGSNTINVTSSVSSSFGMVVLAVYLTT